MTKQQFSAMQTDQEALVGLYEGRDVETVQMICVDDDQYIESHRVSDWGVSGKPSPTNASRGPSSA